MTLDRSRINYSPFVHSQWVEFNGYRFKNPHMVRFKDGTELIAFPNGAAWGDDSNAWHEDAEITHIMALPDNVPGVGRQMHGGFRIARDIFHRGRKYPIWCGKEYGFIYEDQLPEGKQILPVHIQAYRSKGIGQVTTLFVTQGVVVDAEKTVPVITDFKKYTQVPGFWYDENAEIMSENELVHAINWTAHYLKIKESNPVAVEVEAYLREVVGLRPQQYLSLFGFAVKQWETNREDFCRQMETKPDEKQERRWQIFLENEKGYTLTKRSKEIMTNALRGPRPDETFTVTMLEISNFLKNPLVLPPSLTPGINWIQNVNN